MLLLIVTTSFILAKLVTAVHDIRKKRHPLKSDVEIMEIEATADTIPTEKKEEPTQEPETSGTIEGSLKSDLMKLDYYHPAHREGNMLDSSAGLGEPLNVIFLYRPAYTS